MEKEGEHTVTIEEFMEMVSPKVLNRDPGEEMLKVFNVIDEDGTGGITYENLKKISDELNESYTEQELRVSLLIVIKFLNLNSY